MVEIQLTPLAPAWARDPFGRYPHRLFDGRAWTEERIAHGGKTTSDSFLIGSPSPASGAPERLPGMWFRSRQRQILPEVRDRRTAGAATSVLLPVREHTTTAGAVYCDSCGSRLDALAPGLSVQAAHDWQRLFQSLGWRKDAPDPERPRQDSLKKARRGNVFALLREWELPAFPDEDPSEPWPVWFSTGARRSPWLIADSAELVDKDTGDTQQDRYVDRDTLPRYRVVARLGRRNAVTRLHEQPGERVRRGVVGQRRVPHGHRRRRVAVAVARLESHDRTPAGGIPHPVRRESRTRRGIVGNPRCDTPPTGSTGVGRSPRACSRSSLGTSNGSAALHDRAGERPRGGAGDGNRRIRGELRDPG